MFGMNYLKTNADIQKSYFLFFHRLTVSEISVAKSDILRLLMV